MNRDSDFIPIPKIDLAPKLKRPLSSSNPLDYLRLLFWAIFFPQAFRKYKDHVISSYIILVAGLTIGLAVSLVAGIIGMPFEIIRGVLVGAWIGMTLSIIHGVEYVGIDSKIAGYITLYMSIYVTTGVLTSAGRISSLIPVVLVSSLSHLRLESWLLGTLRYFLKDRSWQEAHGSVSFIPIPSLSKQFREWLEKDWQIGLQNINQILEYTGQFIPVIQSVNNVLSKTPSTQLLIKISQLATDPFDWKLVKFCSASLSNNIKYEFIEGLLFLPTSTKQKITKNLLIDPRLDTSAHAAAAGFWYLHQGQLHKAQEAFDIVTSLPHGKEMRDLVDALNNCALSNLSLSLIAAISLPPIPPAPHLRPDSWIAIASFHNIIANIKIVQTSSSQSARYLAINRALVEVDNLLSNSANSDNPEKHLVSKIAMSWQSKLQKATREVIEVVIRKPINNPYIIGDPVQGAAFIGREDIINQLSELWLQNQSVQSVLLFGHRRMGKTSILRNIRRKMGDEVYLAYINLLLLSNPQGEADILMFICDEIQRVTNIDPPPNSEFAAFPQNTCRRYIQQVCDRLNNKKLIIALDEFEQIENFIKTEKISYDFLTFLRGLVQISPKTAFAFAGLHTLEEMTADYFHPFFTSFIPIHIGFLSLFATRQLLANPADPDFPLDYTTETLDRIYQLTAGQPYLTQLVGFQLVRHYNNQVFEEGQTRAPMLTLDDLNTVIQDPVFFDRGRYYFTGVWNQANQDVPHQQTILTALAPHLTGLTLSELSTATNLTLTELNAALKVLERHDVAVCEQEKWRISIELFRRWVIDRLYAQQ
jgi:AAA-like domain